MALAVTSRLEEDTLSKQAGFIIDSSGAISQGRNGVYDNIEHIVSEFSGACDVLHTTSAFPLPTSPMYIHAPKFQYLSSERIGNQMYVHTIRSSY